MTNYVRFGRTTLMGGFIAQTYGVIASFTYVKRSFNIRKNGYRSRYVVRQGVDWSKGCYADSNIDGLDRQGNSNYYLCAPPWRSVDPAGSM